MKYSIYSLGKRNADMPNQYNILIQPVLCYRVFKVATLSSRSSLFGYIN